MSFPFKPVFYLNFILLTVLFSCRNHYKNEESVEKAMKKYDSLIVKMNADSIAMLYTPDGDLGKMAHGRDSIRKFLTQFKYYKVLSQSSTTDLISIEHDTALQTGTYQQQVVVFGKDTVTVKGVFNTIWIWLEGSGWHIRRMETQPRK